MARTLGVDIRIILKTMFCAALWVPSSSSYFAKISYGSFIIVTGVLEANLALCHIAYLISVDFDLVIFVHTLATLTPCIKVFMILTRMTFMKEHIQNLVNNFTALRSSWKTGSEYENKVLNSARKEAQILRNGILSGYMLLTLFMIIKPLIVQDTSYNYKNSTDFLPKRSFITPSWYPWDNNSTPIYAVTYISQVYAVIMIVSQVTVFQTLNTSMLIQIAAEVDIICNKYTSIYLFNPKNHLGDPEIEFSKVSNPRCIVGRSSYRIANQKIRNALNKEIVSKETNSTLKKNMEVEDNAENFDKNTSGVPEYVNSSISIYDKAEDEVYKRLIEIIKHHQNVFSFSKELDNIMSPFYLFQFSSIIFGLCFSSFLASLPSLDSQSRMQFIVFTAFLTVQLLLPCWYGQRVKDQSERLRDAVYGCRWYNESARFKKAIHIIIMRCQRPICFSIGGFGVICLETWLSLINFTYSLLAVLRQMEIEVD